MSNRDYKAGNGEDEIFLVLADGFKPMSFRNRFNAEVVAKSRATQHHGRSLVYNTEFQEVVEVYDFRLTAGPADDTSGAGS